MLAFVACIGLAFAGAAFYFIEAAALRRWSPWVFRIGAVAVRRQEAVDRPAGLAGSRSVEVDGVLCRVVDGRCFFRNDSVVDDNDGLHGTIEWSNGTLSTTGRVPLGILIGWFAWLAGWTVGCVSVMRPGAVMISVAFGLVGWVGGGGIMVGLWLKGRRVLLADARKVKRALGVKS